jgi:hypothetical protein
MRTLLDSTRHVAACTADIALQHGWRGHHNRCGVGDASFAAHPALTWACQAGCNGRQTAALRA